MTPARVLRAIARRAKTFASLPRADHADFLAAWGDLLTTRVRLGLPGAFGARIVRDEMDGASLLETAPHEEEARLLELFRLAETNHVLRFTCLARSIALKRFLERHGIASRLRIGVRKEGAALDGHAWLERAEVVLNDHATRVKRYHAFDCGAQEH
jgi:hypothetical protein